jgi:NAD-dependent deacetylase
MFKEFDDCKMLVVIGTSGNVVSTDMFLPTRNQRLKGKGIQYSILNNLEFSDAIDDKLYSKVLYKKATEAIDEIVQDVHKFLKGEIK